jgi:hypothetical protein
LVVLFDQVTIVVVWSLNQSFLFFVWLSYCYFCFIFFVMLLHWVAIIVSLLSYSYFFGVIRLLIFVFHEIASTFKNSKGSTTKTFTYVKHHPIFFCCHPTTFMHFIFYAESECYDAIISSTPTFSFVVFIKKGSCVLELLSKVDWRYLFLSFEYLWFFWVMLLWVTIHCNIYVLWSCMMMFFIVLWLLLHYWSIFFNAARLVLFVFHHIICGVVLLHFFNNLQLLLYHLSLSQSFLLCCN